MKKLIPSFRLQLVLVFFVLLLISVLFTRSYFLQSFRKYLEQIRVETMSDRLNQIYSDYSAEIPEEEREVFKTDVETVLVDLKQVGIVTDFYRRQIITYSVFVFIFISISVLIIFLISLNLITRPLQRLQEATRELSRGNVQFQVRESRFSPINDLVVSFNRMVRELEQNRRWAIETEKKLIWREIARVMAHEIKNPLTPIKLSVERLEYKYRQNPADIGQTLEDSVAIVKEEIDNLQGLVERFRDFAMMPEAKPEMYRLDEQLREIANLYNKEYRITLCADGELPQFFGDKMQMKQVFLNLAQNAVQAMGPDGELRIDAAFRHPYFEMRFRDNGPGIAPETREKIFEPYFTTKRKGTGLGLPVVKRIIENHGGTIRLDSQPGAGSAFVITIPYANLHSTVTEG